MDIDELQKTVDSMGQLLVTDEEFHEAASTVAAVTNLTDEQRLQMYGLFKTVTVGAVNTSRPWGVDFVGCAKWDSWKKYENWERNKAKLAYIVVVRKISGGEMPGGPSTDGEGMGKVASTPAENEGTNATPWSSGEALFQAIIDEDLEKARQLLSEGAPATQFSQDELRMTPLHYAVDRGLLEMTKLLLEHGADVNSVDAEGNIALYNAVVCEHEEIIPLLMEAKSDVNIINNENSSIATMTDIPESILALLNLPK